LSKTDNFFCGCGIALNFSVFLVLTLSITAGLGFSKLSEYSKDNEKKQLKHLLLVFFLVSGRLSWMEKEPRLTGRIIRSEQLLFTPRHTEENLFMPL